MPYSILLLLLLWANTSGKLNFGYPHHPVIIHWHINTIHSQSTPVPLSIIHYPLSIIHYPFPLPSGPFPFFLASTPVPLFISRFPLLFPFLALICPYPCFPFRFFLSIIPFLIPFVPDPFLASIFLYPLHGSLAIYLASLSCVQFLASLLFYLASCPWVSLPPLLSFTCILFLLSPFQPSLGLLIPFPPIIPSFPIFYFPSVPWFSFPVFRSIPLPLPFPFFPSFYFFIHIYPSFYLFDSSLSFLFGAWLVSIPL